MFGIMGSLFGILGIFTFGLINVVDTAIEMIERTHELEIALREFAWSDDSESQADCV